LFWHTFASNGVVDSVSWDLIIAFTPDLKLILACLSQLWSNSAISSTLHFCNILQESSMSCCLKFPIPLIWAMKYNCKNLEFKNCIFTLWYFLEEKKAIFV